MKDKWLNDFRDRVSDFEMDPPDGLWDDIEKEDSKLTKSRHATMWIWTRRAGIAAAVAFVAVLAVSLLDKTTKQIPLLAVSESTVKEHGKTASSSVEKVNIGNALPTSRSHTASLRSRKTAKPILTAPAVTPIADSIPTQTAGNIDNNIEAQESPGIDNITQKSETKSDKPHIDNSIPSSAPDHTFPVRRPEKRGMNLSVHTNGLLASGDNQGPSFRNPGYNSGPVGGDIAEPDNTDPDGSDTRGATASTLSGGGAGVKATHHRPIRVGTSFLWMIDNRFGIGTGLTYTYLASDFQTETPVMLTTEKQTLHYIGIPVNAYFNIVRWKRINVYASAGVLAEKCVSAKLKSEGLSEKMETYSTTSNINEHPFQLSANLSAGVEWNFAGNFGIYLEPGVSYYFKDNSDLQTFYKEHPFDFNLNLGIRFTIGH